MVGATTVGVVLCIRRAARCDTSCTQRQSTMLGKCGPCCSVAPIGTMTMALRAASALISEAFSLDHSISLMSLKRGQLSHRDAQPLLVQPVEFAVHGVEEDEAVEPAQQIGLAHADAYVGRAAADGELELELLVRVALLQVGNDQGVGGEQLGLARQIGGGGRGVVLGAHDRG